MTRKAQAQGLLTWAGGVSTDWPAGDRFTAHLSQLKKQKDTHEETQSVPTTSSRALQGLLCQQWDTQKSVASRGPNTWALAWMTDNASQQGTFIELPKREGWVARDKGTLTVCET